jgi:hypothetical protein
VAHGKAQFKPKDEAVETKQIKVSKTDPDSGYMTQEGKPQGFFYLDHRTVDAKHSFIVDTVVTPASVHDSVPYLDRLARTKERFELAVKAVGLDAGYTVRPSVNHWLSKTSTASLAIAARPIEKAIFISESSFTRPSKTPMYAHRAK